jgi:hypothetical protein
MAAARRSAFTYVELVAVVSATMIAVALAYSVYRTYRVRAQVAEGVALAAQLIPDVTEHFRRYGEVPAEAPTPSSPVAAVPGNTVLEAIEVVDGRIDVFYGRHADPAIAGRRLSLTPYETADAQVVWICGNRAPGPGLMPLGFAGGGRQTIPIATAIAPRYLTRDCR